MGLFEVLDYLTKYGPLMSGLGLLGTCGAAWYTAKRVTQSNAEKDRAQREEMERQRTEAAKKDAAVRAIKTFQVLYQEMWKDPDVTYARRCVYNDEEYKEIEHVLEKRNQTKPNILTRGENNALEKVDRFCSILVRIKAFSWGEGVTEQQRKLWKKLLEDFWLERIRTDRSAFHTYILNHWPELEQPLESKPSISPSPNVPANQNINPGSPPSLGERLAKFASFFFLVAVVIIGAL